MVFPSQAVQISVQVCLLQSMSSDVFWSCPIRANRPSMPKVYFRAGILEQLEEERGNFVRDKVLTVQRVLRGNAKRRWGAWIEQKVSRRALGFDAGYRNL